MKVLYCVIFLTLFAYLPARAQAAGDEAELRALGASFERAWNRHDMKPLADLFTEAADFVNVGAKHWKGRKEIEAQTFRPPEPIQRKHVEDEGLGFE